MVRRMSDGRFITFEGGDGVGKTTQIARLAERLERASRTVRLTREPGGTPFAERLRGFILDPETPEHSALSETLLFVAARHDHVERLIRPELGAGKWVLCDRFIDSTRAYQGVAGTVPRATLAALETLVHGDCAPDLTIVLDLDPEEGRARRASRRDGSGVEGAPSDRYEQRDVTFQMKLQAAFLEIAAEEPDRCRVIDAGRPVERVHEDIWAVVRERFGIEGA
jgi:dTMP kinase